VRRTKTYSRDNKDRFAIARADSWFKNFAAHVDAKQSLGGQVAASLAELSGAHLPGWMAEGPAGTRPLAAVASSESLSEAQARAPALVMTIALTIDGVPWCGASLAGSARGNSP
jgi:hypothetical protein